MSGNGSICLLGTTPVDRRAFRLLLEVDLGIEVAQEGDLTALGVWEELRRRPSVVLIVTDRLETAAYEATQVIIGQRRRPRVIVFSGSTDRALLQAWGRAGIHAYVLKSDGLAALEAAMAAVAEGGRWFSREVARELEGGQRQASSPPRLSRRELELLPLLARGLTLQEAATAMTVSYKTADSYRTGLLRKLGVRDRVELARYAIREGIIEA